MLEAMNKGCFHGIALYGNDKGFIVYKPEISLANKDLSN